MSGSKIYPIEKILRKRTRKVHSACADFQGGPYSFFITEQIGIFCQMEELQ